MASSLYGATGLTPIKGTGYSQLTMPNKSADQMALFNMGAGSMQQNLPQMLQQLGQMSAGGSPEMWQQMEAPAMRQFGALQGGISSRFSGAGMGARRSSGFQNTMNDASVDLAERLQAQRMGVQQSAQDRLMRLYADLMGQDLSTNSLIPKKKPWWEELLGGIGSGIGSGIGQIGGLLGGLKLGNLMGLGR